MVTDVVVAPFVREVKIMNVAIAIQPSPLETTFHVLNRFVQRFTIVTVACEQLSRLTQMRIRSEVAGHHQQRSDALYKLRTRSRRSRLQECKARGHWFCREYPVYQSPVNYNYLPTASYGDDTDTFAEISNQVDRSLLNSHKLNTMKLLLESARTAAA